MVFNRIKIPFYFKFIWENSERLYGHIWVLPHGHVHYVDQIIQKTLLDISSLWNISIVNILKKSRKFQQLIALNGDLAKFHRNLDGLASRDDLSSVMSCLNLSNFFKESKQKLAQIFSRVILWPIYHSINFF